MNDSRPIVVAARKLPAAVEDRLRETYTARLNADDHTYGRDELLSLCEGAFALLTSPADKLDGALIAALPESVRVIATFSVGYEHIDVPAARARGVVVTNTPGVLTDATADIALLLLLGAARRAGEGERLVRSGAWTGWRPTQMMGVHVTGKRLGIVGMGRIGQAVAHRARAFGMQVHYLNRRRLPASAEQGAVFHPAPESLLPVIDMLSLHCPLTAETRGWLNAERIARLPRGAVVVNTARGDVVDDAALIAALRAGHVAAAGLDVFAGEPALHPAYRELPNTFLLPHLGSATLETRLRMGHKAVDNIDAVAAGQAPPDPV